MRYRVTFKRWSDGQVIEEDRDEADLYRLQGDVLRVRRIQKTGKLAPRPDPRAVAARAFGQARKL